MPRPSWYRKKPKNRTHAMRAIRGKGAQARSTGFEGASSVPESSRRAKTHSSLREAAWGILEIVS